YSGIFTCPVISSTLPCALGSLPVLLFHLHCPVFRDLFLSCYFIYTALYSVIFTCPVISSTLP
ncbi:hypothetical protein NDU88_009481, partial [Pleurodeles waltl]